MAAPSSLARVPPALWLALAAALIHGRHLGFPLVGDDAWLIGRLPGEISLPQLAQAWSQDPTGGQGLGLYRPLLRSLWLLEAGVGGARRAFAVHAFNLALLVAVAAAFHAFLRRVGLGRGAALGAALVPIVHPASVEVINRGMGQGEMMTALLTIAALSLSLCDSPRAPLRLALFALTIFTGALFKETMLTIPAPAVLLALAARPWRWRWAAAVAGAGAGAIVLSLALRSVVIGGQLTPPGAVRSLPPMGFGEHVTTAFALVARYLVDAAVPTLPAVDHAHLAPGFPPPTVIWLPAAGLLACALGAAALIAPRRRRAPVALVWFGVSLLPVLHLVPIASLYASRHLWPALFPFAWAAAWCFQLAFRERPAARWPAVLWLALCAAITSVHVGEHRDMITLWNAAVRRHPDNPVAHQHLAAVLLAEAALSNDPARERAVARRHLAESLALWPDQPSAWATLGRLELDERRFDAAEAALTRALEMAPDHLHALFDLGVLRTTRGDWPGARACWERVLALDPNYPNAQAFLERLPE